MMPGWSASIGASTTPSGAAGGRCRRCPSSELGPHHQHLLGRGSPRHKPAVAPLHRDQARHQRAPTRQSPSSTAEVGHHLQRHLPGGDRDRHHADGRSVRGRGDGNHVRAVPRQLCEGGLDQALEHAGGGGGDGHPAVLARRWWDQRRRSSTSMAARCSPEVSSAGGQPFKAAASAPRPTVLPSSERRRSQDRLRRPPSRPTLV